MTVLLLRLEGPMQAWGTHSRFSERDTGREPSKSGVIGLLCCVLGRKRSGDISDLQKLRMGVRVDREGVLMMDFHTALEVPKAGNPRQTGTVISNRYYLSDSCFLVGLEGNADLIAELREALDNPIWSPFLGRKSFLPTTPFLLDGSEIEVGLKDSFLQTPWLGRAYNDIPSRIRVVEETNTPTGDIKMDNPVSFDSREFSPRSTVTYWIDSNELPGRDKSAYI